MKLNRHHIYLIGVVTGFLFAGIHILNFYLKSDFAKGKLISWAGHTPEIEFKANGKSYTFLGASDIDLRGMNEIEVIYDNSNPGNASIYTFYGFYMFYFYFLVVPFILYTAFIYSWFDKNDYVIVDFKKKKISKSRESFKSDQKSIL